MTLGRLAEVLDEMQEDAERDFRPETLKYVIETLNEIRRRSGLDTRDAESK